jgi:hypothetical protein
MSTIAKMWQVSNGSYWSETIVRRDCLQSVRNWWKSGPSVLQAGPQETGRTGIPDASMFCIAEARGFLPFFG